MPHFLTVSAYFTGTIGPCESLKGEDNDRKNRLEKNRLIRLKFRIIVYYCYFQFAKMIFN